MSEGVKRRKEMGAEKWRMERKRSGKEKEEEERGCIKCSVYTRQPSD